jgi:hypothetical protein
MRDNTVISHGAAAYEKALFVKRAKFINEVVGTLAISFGYAALGTDAPRLYALLGSAFILMLMVSNGRKYERIFKLWREVDHPLLQFRIVWRHYLIFSFGWIFLGLVATGLFTKAGILGLKI